MISNYSGCKRRGGGQRKTTAAFVGILGPMGIRVRREEERQMFSALSVPFTAAPKKQKQGGRREKKKKKKKKCSNNCSPERDPLRVNWSQIKKKKKKTLCARGQQQTHRGQSQICLNSIDLNKQKKQKTHIQTHLNNKL